MKIKRIQPQKERISYEVGKYKLARIDNSIFAKLVRITRIELKGSTYNRFIVYAEHKGQETIIESFYNYPMRVDYY